MRTATAKGGDTLITRFQVNSSLIFADHLQKNDFLKNGLYNFKFFFVSNKLRTLVFLIPYSILF